MEIFASNSFFQDLVIPEADRYEPLEEKFFFFSQQALSFLMVSKFPLFN